MTAGTPTTPPALTAYRRPHRIVLSREWDLDMGRFTPVCETDGIRVYEIDGGLRHDHSEIAELVKRENGVGIDWSLR